MIRLALLAITAAMAATGAAWGSETPPPRFGFVPDSIRDSVANLDLGAPLQWQVPLWAVLLGLCFVWLCVIVWRKFVPAPAPAATGTAIADPAKLPRLRKPERLVRPGRELREALHSCRRALIGVGIFSGVSNVLMLSGSLFMLEVYDRVLPSRSTATLVGLSLLVLVLYAGQGALDLIRARTLGRIGAVFDARLARRAYDLATRLPLWKGDFKTGMQPLRDLDAVRGFLSGLGPAAFFDLPWIPLYLLVIFLFHPILGIAALAGAIGLVILTLIAGRQTAAPSKLATEIGNRRFSFAEMSRRNSEAVFAMGMSGRIAERFEKANRDFNASQLAVSDVATGYSSVSKVLRMVLQSAMLALGAYLVIIGQATAGVMIASSILVGRALAPVDLAISQWKSFVTARESWGRLSTMLAEMPNDPRPMALPVPSSRLAVDAAVVGAPGSDRKLVQDVTFALEAGQALGIIGPSGSGKSTLARALVGAWRTTAGRIRIDNADLSQWAPDELGRHIGYLPQDVSLFAGSVADNISRFEPEPSSDAVIAAARAAGVHDLILSLPQGYSTDVGELGTALSGGQRQRIALARALYGDPFLVVLDEPNSNLDADGDAALASAIEAVRKRGGIVVIVAHRPSALSGVSHVLFLLSGKVQAFGPKDQVLANLFPRPKPVATGGTAQVAAGPQNARPAKPGEQQPGRIADASKEA